MTLLSAGVTMVVSLAGTAVPVAAVPVVAGSVPAAACRIKDSRLAEISGLAVDGGGYVVVNDGADDPAGRRIFFLNRTCKVVRTIAYPSRPRDTEDLARASDGTLWVGDIGDNGRSRTSIGVWRLARGARVPQLFRLSYPDGAHDAEALLVGRDGTPIVVTKDPLTAGVYVPSGPLRAGATTPLRRAGEFGIPLTGTDNPFGFKGRLVITGGAVSPDGRRVVLRTYSDAFELDVPPDGGSASGPAGADPGEDPVVRAIDEGSPRVVALPDEPQGESIAYTPDGGGLLTVSEVAGQGAGGGVAVLRYPLPQGASGPGPAPSATTTPAPSEAAPVGAGPGPGSGSGSGTAGSAGSGSNRIPVGAVAAGLAIAAAAGLVGVLIARRRRNPGR